MKIEQTIKCRSRYKSGFCFPHRVTTTFRLCPRLPPLKLGAQKEHRTNEKKKKNHMKDLEQFQRTSSPQKPISFSLKIVSRNLNAVLKFSCYFRDYQKIKAPWRLGCSIHIYSQIQEYPYTLLHQSNTACQKQPSDTFECQNICLKVIHFSK